MVEITPKKQSKRAVSKRARETQPRQNVGGAVVLPARSSAGIRVTVDSALTYSAVYRAISILSGTIGTLPISIKQRTGDRIETAEDHPAHEVFHFRPNAEQTPTVFKEFGVSQMCLWGNSVSELVFDGVDLVGVWPIPYEAVRPSRNEKTRELEYIIQIDSLPRVVLGAHQVLHVPLMGDGLVGKSPISLARQTIGAGLAMEQHAAALFGNGAMPGGMLEHPQHLSADALENLRKQFEDRHQGSHNAGRTLILEEGMKFHSLTMSSDDAQFLESRNFQVQDVGRWYGIPSHMLGDESRATFSNIEEQARNFITHTLRPWLVRWEEEINHKVLKDRSKGRRFFAKFNLDALLRADSVKRGAFYQVMRNIGVFSVNDIREKEDMNPIGPEGDVRVVQAGVQSLDAIGQEPEPAPEPVAPLDTEATDKGEVQRALREIARDVSGRLVAKAQRSISRIYNKTNGDPDAFKTDVLSFFKKFEPDCREALGRPVRAICALRSRPANIDVEASRFIEQCRKPVLELVKRGKIDRMDQYLREWGDIGPDELAVMLLRGSADAN